MKRRLETFVLYPKECGSRRRDDTSRSAGRLSSLCESKTTTQHFFFCFFCSFVIVLFRERCKLVERMEQSGQNIPIVTVA